MRTMIERRTSVFSLSRFDGMLYPDHLHPQLEIIIPAAGRMTVKVDSQSYLLQAGEALVVFPNHLHSYVETWDCYGLMLIFSPAILPDLGIDWQATHPTNPIIAPLCQDAQYAAARLSFMNPTNDLSREKMALLHLLVEGLLRNLLLTAADKPVEGDLLFSALSCIAEGYQEDISLKQIARQIGCNEYYLSHLFNAQLGIGFRQYVNLLRLDEAGRLLAQSL